MKIPVESKSRQMTGVVLAEWIRGVYRLGWRGNLARWLLMPVLIEEVAKRLVDEGYD